MTVYVDSLHNYGWVLHGQVTPSCHLFTNALDLGELHAMALQIGMRLEWFQDKPLAPHYDLGPNLRVAAIEAGAVPVERREAARLWRARRALLSDRQLARSAPP
jgi:ABC-type uncharacterized transport system YnjBCD ATPase subunit